MNSGVPSPRTTRSNSQLTFNGLLSLRSINSVADKSDQNINQTLNRVSRILEPNALLKFEDPKKKKSDTRKHLSQNNIGIHNGGDSLSKLRHTFFKQSGSIKMKRKTNSMVLQNLTSFKEVKLIENQDPKSKPFVK